MASGLPKLVWCGRVPGGGTGRAPLQTRAPLSVLCCCELANSAILVCSLAQPCIPVSKRAPPLPLCPGNVSSKAPVEIWSRRVRLVALEAYPNSAFHYLRRLMVSIHLHVSSRFISFPPIPKCKLFFRCRSMCPMLLTFENETVTE